MVNIREVKSTLKIFSLGSKILRLAQEWVTPLFS
jgi:hypothetical protein